MPFILVIVVFRHIILLHFIHSQSPVNLKSEGMKFSPNFVFKDLFRFLSFFLCFFILVSYFGFLFSEKDIFEVANPLMSPEHIVPE